LREPYIDKVRHAIGTYDRNRVFWDIDDIDAVYSDFLNVMHSLNAVCMSKKSVAVGPRDADFVTPLVKALLKQK